MSTSFDKPMAFKDTKMLVTLSHNGNVILQRELWELVVHWIGNIPHSIFTDVQKDGILVAKVTFAGAEFIFEVDKAVHIVENKQSHS